MEYKENRLKENGLRRIIFSLPTERLGIKERSDYIGWLHGRL